MPKNVTIIQPKAVIAMPSRFVTSPEGDVPYAVSAFPNARQMPTAMTKAITLLSLYQRDTARGSSMPHPYAQDSRPNTYHTIFKSI